MKYIRFVTFLAVLATVVVCTTSTSTRAQALYPNQYRYTLLDPANVSCYDPEYCLCWHKMDVKFQNDGADAYDVRASMTCRPCSMDDTWPELIYDVELGDIPAGGSAWSQYYFAYKADACDPTCPPFSDNPCWTVSYRNTPGGPVQAYYNVPWIPGWACECGEATTLITLASFDAKAANGSVTLTWETEAETENAGFNLYRSTAADGEYSKINTAIIPAKGAPTAGASYSYVDADARNRRTYYYKLEDVDLNGTATLHGPVSATPRLMYGIFR